MRIQQTGIADVLSILPVRHADDRGWFSESWSRPKLVEAGFDHDFVQDNHSYSREKGTVRGLHCQIAPFVQGKLVRCVRGAILDVAVDIRRGSPSCGMHVARRLSAATGEQLWIPGGFLHGFCTLEPDTEVVYKVTAAYDKVSERGVIWNDPDLRIAWPVADDAAVLSTKDAVLPRLAACNPWFRA